MPPQIVNEFKSVQALNCSYLVDNYAILSGSIEPSFPGESKPYTSHTFLVGLQLVSTATDLFIDQHACQGQVPNTYEFVGLHTYEDPVTYQD